MDLVSRYWKTEHKLFDILNNSLNLKPRPATTAMKRKNRYMLIAAEVGVFYGDNARSILRTLDIEHLYLIDPYEDYNCAGINVKMAGIEAIARKKLAPWNEKITWIRKYSDEAVHVLPDNIDFIYLDANHDYEFIRKDLELYYPKVAKGGILGGHDYKPYHLGTIRAVMEFEKERGLKIKAEPDDWWIEI